MRKKKKESRWKDDGGSTSPCSKEGWCLGMRLALAGSDERATGLRTAVIVNLTTGKTVDIIVTYRVSRSDNGLTLNYCPWCGEKIARDQDTTKAEADPISEDRPVV